MTGLVDQRDEIDVIELEFYKALDSVFHDICLSTDDFTPEEICYTGLLESTALSVPVFSWWWLGGVAWEQFGVILGTGMSCSWTLHYAHQSQTQS